MKSALLSLAVLAASCAAAESFVLPPQGVSPYADTEVSTNVALTCGGAPAFAELLRTRPTGLLRGSWDMARVTRRGVGEPPSDWVACALESLGLAVMVR